MTGKQFVDTYFVRDGSRQAFLVIGKLLNSSRYQKDERAIFMPKAKNKIIDLDHTGIPAVVTRIRFMNAIEACDKNVSKIFIILNQVLTADAIKEFFPEVYNTWYSVFERKRLTTLQNEHNRLVNLGKLPDPRDKDHRECLRITRHMSLREAARSSRLFA